MRSAIFKAAVGTMMFASYAVAQNCPPAPSGLRANDFFSWCESVGGTPVPRQGGQPGDLICKCREKAPAPIGPQVALWVGVPVATSALFAGMQAMSEASQTPEEAISGASNGEESKIGQAAVTGAAVGLAVAAVGFTIAKVARYQPGPVNRDAPWWRRTRLVTGMDRRGATRVGLGW